MDEFPADAVYGEGYVFLESNGGAAEVQAVVNVILEPDVHPTAESVVLTSGAGGDLGGRLSLRNDGMATAHLELQPSSPEIILSRDLCDIKPGKRVRISVRWEGEARPTTRALHRVPGTGRARSTGTGGLECPTSRRTLGRTRDRRLERNGEVQALSRGTHETTMATFVTISPRR